MELFLIYSDYLFAENILTSTRCRRKSVDEPQLLQMQCISWAIAMHCVRWAKQANLSVNTYSFLVGRAVCGTQWKIVTFSPNSLVA